MAGDMLDGPSTVPAREVDEALLCLLFALASTGPQTLKRLAEAMKLSEWAIEGLCATLVTRGLALRIPNELGAIVVALSTGGRRRIDDLIAHDALAAKRMPATQVLGSMCVDSMSQEEP